MLNRISFFSNPFLIKLYSRRLFCNLNPANQSISSENGTDQSPTDRISRKECQKMLDHFRRRIPYENDSYIRLATYFCWKKGLDHEFVDVADEWFRQARQRQFDRSAYIKATSLLCNLGKMNRTSNGVLMEKLKWSDIDYLMNRMAEIGFHRFRVEDIAGALNGLTQLMLIRADNDKNSPNDERKLHPTFLKCLQRYLIENRSSGYDYELLIHDVAPQLLHLLSYTLNHPPTIDLLRPLCRLSTAGFDRMATGDFDISNSNYIPGPHWYARSFLRWKLDPETILRDSWSSWYRASAFLLEKIPDRITLRYLLEISSVAREFNRTNEFWPLYDLWFRRVTETCQNAADLQPEPGSESIERQIVNLVFACGLLIDAFRDDRERVDKIQKSYRVLLPTFEKALMSRPITNYDRIEICFFLTGVTNIKRNLKSIAYEPSTELYEFLRKWCVHQRSTIENNSDTDAATTAALILHLFAEMKLTRYPPTELLDELVNLFVIGINSLDTHAMRMLSFFVKATAVFSIKIKNDSFWDDYFRKVHHLLDESWRKENESGLECALFISSISNAVYKHLLYDKWSRIKDIFERRTFEVMNHFQPIEADYFARTLIIANKHYGLGFDKKMINKLFSIALNDNKKK